MVQCEIEPEAIQLLRVFEDPQKVVKLACEEKEATDPVVLRASDIVNALYRQKHVPKVLALVKYELRAIVDIESNAQRERVGSGKRSVQNVIDGIRECAFCIGITHKLFEDAGKYSDAKI